MVITEDIYLKLGICVHYPNYPYYKGRQFKMHFFSPELCPVFDLKKTLTFCYISIFTEDMYLKLGVCVYYPKSSPYYQGRQFKMHFFFFRILLLFQLFILYQAPHSQALAPACDALVLIKAFLAPLAESQRAIVMVLCPSCVRPSVCPSVCLCVCASVNTSFKKLFLRKC